MKTCLSKVSSRADSAGLFFVGVSFARAGYRGQFVTEIRAGPFYRRNNYFKALRARARLPVGIVFFCGGWAGRFVCGESILPKRASNNRECPKLYVSSK